MQHTGVVTCADYRKSSMRITVQVCINDFVIYFDLRACKLHSVHVFCTYGITYDIYLGTISGWNNDMDSITTVQNTSVHFEYIALNTAALHALDTARCMYSASNTRTLHSLNMSIMQKLSSRQCNSIVVHYILYILRTFCCVHT